MKQMSAFGHLGFILYSDLSTGEMCPDLAAFIGHPLTRFESEPFLLRDLMHPDGCAALERLIERPTDERAAHRLDFRVRLSDGSWGWIRARLLRVEDPSDQRQVFLVCGHDITDLKRIEERANLQRGRLEDFLDVAGVVIVALNADKQVTLINRKGCEVLGDTEENILGKDWFDNYIPMPERIRVKEAFGRLISGETEPVETFENQIQTTNGELRTILWHNALVRDSDGRIIGTLSSGEDVTERIGAERALKQREEQFRVLFEGTHSCVLFIENRVIRYVNQATVDTFGHSREELIGRSTSILYESPEAYERTGVELYSALHRDGFWRGEWPFVFKDGSTIWMEGYVTSLSGSAIIAVLHNITERVETANALAEREARLSSIFRASPVGIGFLIDRVLLEVNERLCEMVGYDADELLNRSARILYESDEEFERVGKVKYAMIAGSGTGTLETRFQRKDGRVIDVLLGSTPLDPSDLSRGVTFTAMDISERKSAELELKRSKVTLATAQQIAAIGSFEWDIKNDIHTVSDEAFRILGVEPGDFSPSFEAFLTFVHLDDIEAVREAADTAFRTGSFDVDHRIVRADGAIRHFRTRGRVIRDERGEPLIMNGTYQDVTERKEAEQALVEKHIALKEVLKQIASESDVVKEQISTNIETAILPTLMRLKETANKIQLKLIGTLEKDFARISSPFLYNLKARQGRLTPREAEIARLIRNGMSSKEIAESLSLSLSTVHKHREMIRKKLGLANEDINLATFLQSL